MNREILCTVKHKVLALSTTVNEKIFQQFGFYIEDVSFNKIVNYLYAPKDSSSLAVTRILFGVAMLFDIAGERGGSVMTERWGNPSTCHFPLVHFIRALPMPYMAVVYAALWLGAVGIALGYKYRISAPTFTLCYWYLFLVEKSFWNNHSYLFGLVATLLSFTDAHCYWSIDAVIQPSIKREVVPYWNYFILKYQFFILYFMAGVKKGSAEWLTGYSVQNLSEHWVFNPFKFFLTVPQTDYLVVHWFVFAFDLTVGVWMMWGRTRHVAMFFCALFHLMNSRLFSIDGMTHSDSVSQTAWLYGHAVCDTESECEAKRMFPWVCMATMPLFYPFDWPKTIGKTLRNKYLNVREAACKCFNFILELKCDSISLDKQEEYVKQLLDNNVNEEVKEDLNDIQQNTNDDVKEQEFVQNDEVKNIENESEAETFSDNMKEYVEEPEASGDTDNILEASNNEKNRCPKILTVGLILFFVLTQAFLPFSHFITQGYNNWTKGLYGYSWDMMVHTWDTNSVVVKIVDNEKNAEFYIDPNLYAPSDRWTRHGDMVHQYAHCLKDNLLSEAKRYEGQSRISLSNNLSVYVDVWCSLNGRFTQRMFDPKQDLLTASWSPLEPVSYLMPLLDEALSWRSVLQDVRREVHSWHNASDVIFIADFPGYVQEKYIPTDLSNVTLTILEGRILYETEPSTQDGQSYELTTGKRLKVDNGMFHKVLNIGETPAYYMYTFVNTSDIHNVTITRASTPNLPIARELIKRLYEMLIFINIVIENILQILFQFTQCRRF